MPRRLSQCSNVDDLRDLARRRLPEIFVQLTKDHASGFSVTSGSCTGDASVVFSRGKRRAGFELCMVLQSSDNEIR